MFSGAISYLRKRLRTIRRSARVTTHTRYSPYKATTPQASIKRTASAAGDLCLTVDTSPGMRTALQIKANIAMNTRRAAGRRITLCTPDSGTR
ncbi:hypothetical protein ACVW00_002276 [Marmoricola sp. URHA0025 HA25]